MKEKWKVFVMAVVGFVATLISTAGNGGVNWWYIVLATVAFVGLYIVKNWLWPATSDEGTFDWRDIVSGVLIAVFMAVSSYASNWVVTGSAVPNWHELWMAVVAAVTGYFSKAFAQGDKVAEV